jgi:hypothetical protein
MKTPVAAAAAFCVGYALGARRSAGRRLQVVGPAGRGTPVAGTATLVGAKAKAVVLLGAERARDTIGVRLGWRDGDEAADALVVEMAGDLASALKGRRISA